MKNLNPLYEYNLLLAPTFGVGDDMSPSTIAKVGAGWTVGIGSKYLKDTRLIKRILSEYPDPMQFKAKLAQLPVNSTDKDILLAKLQPGISEADYIKLLRRYVCGGSLFKYLLHGWGHIYSAMANAADALDNESKDTASAIASNIK